jgi:hypothetical protein
MKVELYLKSINQEMIDAGRRATGRGDLSWMVSWPKSCCVLDFSLTRPDELVSTPVTDGLIMRSEPGGGMFWDPKSGSVYKVDEEAYHAMLELDNGFNERSVARRMGISAKKVVALTEQLKRIRGRRATP